MRGEGAGLSDETGTGSGGETQVRAADETARQLEAALRARTALVAVVGLGYVGLPLVRALHDAGYRVLGYDVDREKVAMLHRGECYLRHLGPDLVPGLNASGRFRATAEAADLRDADAIVLCVPTPLGKHREPDLEYLLSSTRMVAEHLRPGHLVVLESTTFPGTTREQMLPILEARGLRCGSDFFLAYSPEREDPGRPGSSTRTIPKLVGGVDETSGNLAQVLYARCIDEVHRVSSAEIAESAKLLENIYRAVNIALVNELKVVFEDMGIDVWEVIRAAATKPFGYEAFYPGPGLGGHCIPIDPFYLTWRAKEFGHSTRFIELAGEVNSRMPGYVVSRVSNALNRARKPVQGADIIVIGVAYKPDVDDLRESPAAEIIERLAALGASVAYHDPLVPVFPAMRRHRIDLRSEALDAKRVARSDCVVIVTNHSSIDYALLGEHAPLIVDTRNVMAQVIRPKAIVVKA